MVKENRELYDVTIIGGGVAGLYAAYYAGMRDMKTKIIEYLPQFGGTVTIFYSEKYIYDIGGIPKISGSDFIEQMKEQGMMFDPTIILGQSVEEIETTADDILRMTTSDGEIHDSKTIIIAAGPGLIKKGSRGHYCDVNPIREWGYTLQNRRIPVNSNMETKTQGVYAAGDMAGYTGKWRLIASAYNEAITAVNSAKAYIDPSAPTQVYSSILLDR